MALSARLEIGEGINKDYHHSAYNLIDCRCHFAREYNHDLPQTDAKCESIEVTLVSPDKDDLSLYDWYIRQYAQNCRLVFSFTKGNEKVAEETKLIKLEGAKCFGISEEYSIASGNRKLLKLKIMASEVQVNEIKF